MKAKLNELVVTVERIFDKILGGCMALGAVLLVTWVFVFTGTIAGRAFFNMSPRYLEEYTGYWTLIITCLALAYAFRKGVHIRTDVMVNRFSPRARAIIEVFVAVLALATLCVFTIESAKLLLFAISEGVHGFLGTEALLWPVYLLMPVGYGFLSLALLFYFFHAILAVVGKD